MKLGMQVGLGPGHIVLDGDLALPSPKGHSPHFRPIHVVAKYLNGSRCHLERDGLDPSDIVLDGDRNPAPPPRKRAQSPSP